MIVSNNKLANYVRKNAVLAMLGATVALWLLNFSLAFLGELSKLKDSYTFVQAVSYVFWRSPQYLYEFLPMATLVGAVVGLGNLATNSEITVMRAAGVSLYKIVYWVVQAVLVLVVMAVLLNQFVLPTSNAKARLIKNPDSKLLLSEVSGFWLKQENNTVDKLKTDQTPNSQLIYIDYANADGVISGINIWYLDDKEQIMQTTYAKTGKYLAKNEWQLNEVSTLMINENSTSKRHVSDENKLTLPIKPEIIYLKTRPIDDLSISDLVKYNTYLNSQGQYSAEHQLAFWQKLLSPFAFISLAMIACSFVFGSVRQKSMGYRIVVAILVGLGFRYLQDLTGYMGLIYSVSPLWFVLLPIVLSGLLGAFLLKRKR